MTVRLPSNVRSAAADAVLNLINAGSGPGTIELRTGAQPAAAADAATGTLLATFTLNDPAFGAAAAGVGTLSTSPAVSTTGVAAGTAGWFRVKDSNGATVLDGSVSASGGGGDLVLNTTTISVGLTVNAIGGTITMPG
ncbi:hypothetical protein [Dactylosporangium sp. CS-033363]|uniref:hypothetical protein n=1 Tax=Dactylosporangium sp. CS-033363 TaxID=3239935 RepID=UPI003D8E3957